MVPENAGCQWKGYNGEGNLCPDFATEEYVDENGNYWFFCSDCHKQFLRGERLNALIEGIIEVCMFSGLTLTEEAAENALSSLEETLIQAQQL